MKNSIEYQREWYNKNKKRLFEKYQNMSKEEKEILLEKRRNYKRKIAEKRRNSEEYKLKQIEKNKNKLSKKEEKEEIVERNKIQKEYYKKNKEKIKKYQKTKNENYIDDIDFLYEIILSKGKGKITMNLIYFFIKLVDNIISKFYYKTKENDRKDMKQNVIFRFIQIWSSFDEKKYDKCIPYFTEIAKRSIAGSYKELITNNVNLNDCYQF